MSIATNYLEQLYKREPNLFPQSLKKSNLTENDLQEIEEGLGYVLPQQYREFLQSYQMQDMTVYITFCGGLYACSFAETFSREKNDWISVDDISEDDDVVVDLEWYGFGGESATEYLEKLRERVGEMTAWLEAGFIPLGCFYKESYFVYYDLTTGEVDCIHHEDIYLTEDWDDPKANRICMETEGTDFCRNFNDFLRLACLGEPYDEDDMIFPEDKQLWQKWKQHLDEDCADEVEELIWDCVKAGFWSDEEIAEECEMYIEEECSEDAEDIETDKLEQIVGEFRNEWERKLVAQKEVSSEGEECTIENHTSTSEFVNSQHNYQNLVTAFLGMETRGIVTAHYAGFTDDAGFDEVNEEATKRHENGKTITGCCFYTKQDLEHTFHDHPQKLYLCFGNYFDNPTIEEVGKTIVEELENEGFTTEWNGLGNQKIAITNLYWDKIYCDEDE